MRKMWRTNPYFVPPSQVGYYTCICCPRMMTCVASFFLSLVLCTFFLQLNSTVYMSEARSMFTPVESGDPLVVRGNKEFVRGKTDDYPLPIGEYPTPFARKARQLNVDIRMSAGHV